MNVKEINLKKTTYTMMLIPALTSAASGSRTCSRLFNFAAPAQNESTAVQLPAVTQIVIGTFKLDKTAKSNLARDPKNLVY